MFIWIKLKMFITFILWIVVCLLFSLIKFIDKDRAKIMSQFIHEIAHDIDFKDFDND